MIACKRQEAKPHFYPNFSSLVQYLFIQTFVFNTCIFLQQYHYVLFFSGGGGFSFFALIMMHTNAMNIVFLHLSLFYSFNSKLLLFLKEDCYKRMEFFRQCLVHNSFKRLHVSKRQIKQPPLMCRQHLLHKVTINDNTGISFVTDFHPAAPPHKRLQQRGLHIRLSVQNDFGKRHINPK